MTGVPSTFLIDPQGKIIAKEVGFDSDGNSEIEKKLVQVFGKKVQTKNSNAEQNKSRSVKAVPIATIGRN